MGLMPGLGVPRTLVTVQTLLFPRAKHHIGCSQLYLDVDLCSTVCRIVLISRLRNLMHDASVCFRDCLFAQRGANFVTSMWYEVDACMDLIGTANRAVPPDSVSGAYKRLPPFGGRVSEAMMSAS